ncbi:retrovirus-related pol polyprotein from transposon TNT 1-94 [Tanacetum coccineum]
MGDVNPICTVGDYSKPSHEGYRNTIELPVGNNVVSLRSDTIWLVQNGFSFHELRSEDPNQHLKDFLKLVDSLDLDACSITTWEDLTTRFLAQFFPPGRTIKLRNDILMFQKHHGESLSEAWTRFKDLLQKVPHHDIDRSRPTPRPSSTHVPQAYAEAVYSNPRSRNQNEPPKQSPFTFRERTGPIPQPQALGTTFEARVRDYMAAHTERMERFENAIFKQREEINDKMAEMFGLLKELTTSRAPEKVLIREEAKSLVTKNVNSISVARGEEEKNDDNDIATCNDIEKPTRTEMGRPVNKAENGIKNEPIRKAKKEETTEAPSSQLVIQICLWCVDSGCSKHMTGNLKLFINFVWKFLGTVRFGNDHVATILGFDDLQWGNILITRVYFVEGLGHNLFSVGQFCDSDLEVTFRRNTCFVRNLEGVHLLKGNRTTNLYTINLHEMAFASPICLLVHETSTKSWLWHQHLSHLNFDVINDLAKNDLVTGLPKFKYHKEHLCPSYEIASINGKRYVLVIVDDYSRYTWVYFLRSKDETPEVIKTFLKRIIVLLQSLVIINDREDIEKLGAKGDIGFLISYSANSCAYRVYNRRIKKIMDTMNVTFDELSAMAFEQSSSKPGLQSMTSGQISSGLDLTYAPSTITTQKTTKRELDLLFEAMHDDYIGGQPSSAPRTGPAAQAPQVLQTLTDTTTTVDTAPTPTNSSS